MGMYTQLVMGARIKESRLEEVKPILGAMIKGEEESLTKLPDHPFFKTERWDVLFRMDSAYFDMKTHCSLDEDGYLTVITNLKNYNNEIGLFLDWIDEYLDNYTDEFLGFKRYEEDEEPTLIYKGKFEAYVDKNSKHTRILR